MITRILGLALLSAISLPARADSSCDPAELKPNEPMAFLAQAFEAGRYECAIAFTKSYGAKTSSLPGRDGIDRRFALREAATALAANQRYPIEWRRAVAKAAAWTSGLPNPSVAAREEIHSDVRMLATIANGFISRGYVGVDDDVTRSRLASWIDVLLAALALDRHLQDADRALIFSDFSSGALTDTARLRLYSPLVEMVVVTRGDKVRQDLRAQLASSAYYYMMPWEDKAPKELVLQRCEQALKITDLLSDVRECDNHCGQNWHWRPIMNVGLSRYRIGMQADAAQTIQRSLRLVRAIEDPDLRLSRLRFAFVDLLAIRYDKAVLGPLVREMWQLANSLDTPIAKEVQQGLPDTLKRWGVSDLLQ